MSVKREHSRDSSRYPLSDSPEETRNGGPTAGTKRLYSNRESKHSAYHYDENGELEDADRELHSGKRYRGSDWPLSRPIDPNQSNAPSPKALTRNRNGASSPLQPRRSTSQARPSKFLEGSMNDRVSQMPPPNYVGDEDYLRGTYEEYEHDVLGNIGERKLAKSRKHGSVAGSTGDRSDASRHSSIFRFGKSIAASFNPHNWKIWSERKQQVVETPEEKVLRERKEKAYKIYKELKYSGNFRDADVPPFFQALEHQPAAPTKHDSVVEIDSSRMSHDKSRGSNDNFRMSNSDSRRSYDGYGTTPRDEKRMGRVYLEPPSLQSSGNSPGSMAESNTSPRKKAFHFKTPSLSNIRKTGSDSGSNASDLHQARRIPSRKDLQKQQKLVKRVSDLEGKLEAARRQLTQVLGEPMPSQLSTPSSRIGRSRFVPGALSTLPSERLLSGYVSTDVDADDDYNEDHAFEIGKAVTSDHKEPAISGARADGFKDVQPKLIKENYDVLELFSDKHIWLQERQKPWSLCHDSQDGTLTFVGKDAPSTLSLMISSMLRVEYEDAGNHIIIHKSKENNFDGSSRMLLLFGDSNQKEAFVRRMRSSNPVIKLNLKSTEYLEKVFVAVRRRAESSSAHPLVQPKLEKTLPQVSAPQLQASVTKSVEVSDEAEMQSEQPASAAEVQSAENTTNYEPTTESEPTPEPSDSSYEEDGVKTEVSDDLVRRKKKKKSVAKVSPANPKSTPPKKQVSKKRKSLDDDGGIYKPGNESETEESVVKKVKSPKRNTALPRKLQKVNQQPISNSASKEPHARHGAMSQAENQPSPAPRHRIQSKTASAISSRKLTPVKSRIPRRQSTSPPPTASFFGTGLEYKKPALQARPDGSDDEAYSAVPSANDVPPMPPMPKAVRLPSGELIQTAPSSLKKSLSVTGKLTKSRPISKGAEKDGEKERGKEEKRNEQDESHEWPDFVF